MNSYLQRAIFLFVLLSLAFNELGTYINISESAYWEPARLADLQLALEEEAEFESDDERWPNDTYKTDSGDGGDEESIEIAKSKGFGQFQSLFALPLLVQDSKSNLAQIASNHSELLNKPKARLFLLFHNFKSDLAHSVA